MLIPSFSSPTRHSKHVITIVERTCSRWLQSSQESGETTDANTHSAFGRRCLRNLSHAEDVWWLQRLRSTCQRPCFLNDHSSPLWRQCQWTYILYTWLILVNCSTCINQLQMLRWKLSLRKGLQGLKFLLCVIIVVNLVHVHLFLSVQRGKINLILTPIPSLVCAV